MILTKYNQSGQDTNINKRGRRRHKNVYEKGEAAWKGKLVAGY